MLASVATAHGAILADGISPVSPSNLCTVTFVCVAAASPSSQIARETTLPFSCPYRRFGLAPVSGYQAMSCNLNVRRQFRRTIGGA
jgi:hypothetical protein